METQITKEGSIRQALLRNARIWLSKLTEFEKHAIKKYTFNSMDRGDIKFFAQLNYLSRTYAKLPPKYQKYSDALSSAIAKFEIPFDLEVYRTQYISLGDYKVNDIVNIDQFFSTSISKNGTLNHRNYFLTIRIRKGVRAAYIELLSHFPRQYELLLDKGLSYKIIEITGSSYILEVIDNE